VTAEPVPGVVRNLAPGFDEIRIFTPLGIRFWDAAWDVPVTNGLDVIAWPEGQPSKWRQGVRSLSGVIGLHGLPGMHDVEYPGAGAAPGSPPVARRYAVRVQDLERRFIPVAFHVDLPQFGIYPSNSVTPSGPPLPGFMLYSAPTRSGTAGLAVVRAQLVEDSGGAPAAYAVVEVEAPQGRIVHGIADQKGSAIVAFSFPAFRPGATASPPSTQVGTQTWPVQVRVRYAPFLQTSITGTSVPDLRSVLAQGPAQVRPTSTSSSLANELSAELEFGRELVIRTSGLPELIVRAAASPP
jgi:hypothetical protein